MKNDYADGGDIDLSEILASVRPALWIAVLVGLLCAVAAYNYGRTLDRQYQTTARFTISDGSPSSQFGRIGDFVPGLLPQAGGLSEAELVADKVMSRDFLPDLEKRTPIASDPYFNGLDDTPGPVATLLGWIFGSTEPTEAQLRERIVRRYNRAVSVGPTDTGVIEVSVVHVVPERAAEVANAIVNTHMANIERKRMEDNQRQVDLTEDRLREAQKDLDEALEATQVFAVENSIRSREDLGVSSLNLNRFREELETLDAKAEGLAYLEERRREAPFERIDVNDFIAANPAVYSDLQFDLDWVEENDSFKLPSRAAIESEQRIVAEGRERLRRAIKVIEERASRNADAARRIAELEREVDVRKAIYTSLVSQFEARDFDAQLQNRSSTEWIQRAVVPVRPFAPRPVMFALLAAILSGAAVVGLRLFHTLYKGRLYTARKIGQAFGLMPIVYDAASDVGRRPKPLKLLSKAGQRSVGVGLMDLAIGLREQKLRTLMVLGVPRTPTVRNLALTLAVSLGEEGAPAAVIEPTKAGSGTMPTRSYGILKETENTGRVTVFQWVERPPESDDGMSFEDAVARMDELFAHIVFVSAPIGRGVLFNRLALGRADRVLLLATPGMTTRRDIERITHTLARAPDVETSLAVA